MTKTFYNFEITEINTDKKLDNETTPIKADQLQ